MAKRNAVNTATSNPQKTNNGSPEAKPARYVVVRDGYRVSDKEYETPTDPVCIAEIGFWNRVAKNHSHGEKVAAVPYDSKRHRVW
jgi:hypothetical protein